MKIALAGYSGAGKSTLAQRLGTQYGVPVLHLDTVQWVPGWRERDAEEQQRIVREFLDSHGAWVIDGNYSALCFERRMEEADRIVLLLLPRFVCLLRVLRRYRRWKGRTRPDMGEGCAEKVDAAFLRWVLWDGRTGRKRKRFAELARRYPDKTVVVRSRRALERLRLDSLPPEGKVPRRGG